MVIKYLSCYFIVFNDLHAYVFHCVNKGQSLVLYRISYFSVSKYVYVDLFSEQ